MQFRNREKLIQVVRPNPAAAAGEPKAVVVGAIMKPGMTFRPRPETQVTDAEMAEIQAYIEGQAAIGVLRRKLTALELPETAREVADYFATLEPGPERDQILTNIGMALQTLRAATR